MEALDFNKSKPDVKLEDSMSDPPKDVEYMDPGKMGLDKFKNIK